MSWAAGDEGKTPTGRLLPDRRTESYCAFRIGEGEDGNLAKCLRAALTALEPAADYIAEVRRTGGRLNFFITRSVGERGETFDVALLATMARLGIDLGISPLAEEEISIGEWPTANGATLPG